VANFASVFKYLKLKTGKWKWKQKLEAGEAVKYFLEAEAL